MSRSEAAAAVRAIMEQGRRLASEREELIAQGVDPAALEVPLAPAGAAATLPTAGPRTFTLNEDELHDLTYHAATTYLYGLASLTKARAQQHAIRIANAAVVHALASDYRND